MPELISSHAQDPHPSLLPLAWVVVGDGAVVVGVSRLVVVVTGRLVVVVTGRLVVVVTTGAAVVVGTGRAVVVGGSGRHANGQHGGNTMGAWVVEGGRVVVGRIQMVVTGAVVSGGRSSGRLQALGGHRSHDSAALSSMSTGLASARCWAITAPSARVPTSADTSTAKRSGDLRGGLGGVVEAGMGFAPCLGQQPTMK